MNKKGFFGGFLFVFFFALCSLFVSAQRFPKPTGYVNDYARIMNSSDRQMLENKLSQYDKLTTIQVTVMTTSSLDGMEIEEYAMKLFKEWGVGKKGKDNGVLIVVAPNERAIRIETGYGMEADLPDAICSRIIYDLAIPEFKQGDYSAGVIKAVDGIIAKLGGQNIQDREASRAAMQKEREQRAQLDAEQARVREEKAKESREKFFSALFVVFIFLLPIVGLALLFFWVRNIFREHKRKKALRKQLVVDLAKSKDVLENAEKRLKEANDLSASFPDWAAEKANALLAKIQSGLQDVRSKHQSVSDHIKKDPDKANDWLHGAVNKLEQVADQLSEVMKDLPAQVKHYEDKAPETVKSCQQAFQATHSFIMQAQEKGFRFADQKAKLTKQEEQFLSAKALLKDKKNSRQVVEILEACEKRVKAIKESAAAVIALKDKNEKYIKQIPQELTEIQKSVPATSAVLEGLKKNHPPENWQSLEKSFLLIAALIAATSKLRDSASASNSMDKQEFAAASKELKQVEDNLVQVNGTMYMITTRKKEIDEAQKSYPSKLRSAEQNVSQAASAVHHSDVTQSTRHLVVDANTKLSSVKKLLDNDLINWLIVSKLLDEANSQAEEAVSHARKDKRDAEEERERIQREEEEEEDRRRRARSSSSFGGGFGSGSSSSGSSSGGFGGFGGGSSGGGGASGKW